MPLLARCLPLVAIIALAACGPKEPDVNPNLARLDSLAQRVTIIRDDWGIAHVYGKTDADAVFGMIYAQAEDDFNRVETNYLNALGRLAEAEGEKAVIQDLRQKLFMDPVALKQDYDESPDWLKVLMTAWADGLNYYLLTHPEVKPRAITHFEPWMPLAFSEGSIGGDIESISLAGLEDFYGKGPQTVSRMVSTEPAEPTGSNGFAISPSNTAAGRALLLINPHTSFYFRSELQMVSEEGLNAYGAVTWGQFFVYQGWNERVGWMHTSSGVDAIDEWEETIVKRGDSVFYVVGTEEKPMQVSTITVPYKADSGLKEKSFTVYRTEHGPVVREKDGKWISVGLMHEPVKALTESYGRTKARNFEEFKQTVELQANSSNNTVYADADGNIAYWHASFIPRRNDSFDWTRPVDGSNPDTRWQGLHGYLEIPSIINPPTGWIQNTNNWPWSGAGPNSPKQQDYPKYVDTYPENPRGLHAIRVLDGKSDFTLQSLIDAAYDSYQPAFAQMVPPLIRDYDRLPAIDSFKAKLREPVDSLRKWDYRWGVNSVPNALAIYWGEIFYRRAITQDRGQFKDIYGHMARGASSIMRLGSLSEALDRMDADFGTWRTPWGEINRFQRLTNDIDHKFSDEALSIPVGFTSARWGSLASYGGRWADRPTKKFYGTYGNSFVAAVEFGSDSVRARAITAGGESGDVKSKHFNDQAGRYATGDLREVYFYRNQLEGHIEREYHPGN